MAANESVLTLEKLREMMKAIPPSPEIFWTHLLKGKTAYQRGNRSYISLEAVGEFKKLPARETNHLMARGWGTVDILNAEDAATSALGYIQGGNIIPREGPVADKGQEVMRDLIHIAIAEYGGGEAAGKALHAAFYRPAEEAKPTMMDWLRQLWATVFGRGND